MKSLSKVFDTDAITVLSNPKSMADKLLTWRLRKLFHRSNLADKELASPEAMIELSLLTKYKPEVMSSK